MIPTRFARLGFAFVLVVTCLGLAGVAQPVRARPANEPAPFATETSASVMVGGEKIDYTVTTGRLEVIDRTGKARSNIFFIAYTRKCDAKPENRPLTFCFNGGPGASSSYVHIAAFGPRCLAVGDDGKSVPKPYKLVDNANTLLDATDLVFIDPVSTGYSRAEKDEEARLFHGLEEDTHAVGEFIRNYVEKYDRGASPTFIAGESYGTTRAAALTSYLQSTSGVKLVGILLISTVLDFATISFGANNDLPNILFLPTYTAAALHHKKIAGDPARLLEQAESFANGPYAEALKKGKDLTDDEKADLAKTLTKYTGLSEEYLLKVNLRINAGGFRTELLRDTKEVIGRYDSRVKAALGDRKGGGISDPSSALMSPPLTECLKNYLADDLKLTTDLKYNISGRVQPWSYGMPRGKATVVPRLKAAMQKDESLRVFVACGYCDLATPYSAAKYTMAKLGSPALRDRVTIACYEGGHMMYTVKDSHQKLKSDMARFIAGSPAAAAEK